MTVARLIERKAAPILGTRILSQRTDKGKPLLGPLHAGTAAGCYPGAARAGFYPGERDVSYQVLRALAALGIVTGVRDVPSRVLAEGRRT